MSVSTTCCCSATNGGVPSKRHRQYVICCQSDALLLVKVKQKHLYTDSYCCIAKNEHAIDQLWVRGIMSVVLAVMQECVRT
jgi:hypothetical protein